MKLKTLVLFIGLFFLVYVSVEGQSVWTWQPNVTQGKDAEVKSNTPDLNFETETSAYAGAWPDPYVRRIHIQFNNWQDSIGVGSVVDSAFVDFYETNRSGSNLFTFIAPDVQYWEESVLTWNNQPNYDTTLTVVSDTLSDSTSYMHWRFNITPILNAIKNNAINDSGFCVRPTAETPDPGHMIQFATSDNIESYRPKIEIYYTLEGGELTGIIPKVYKSEIQTKVKAGIITPKVRSPN